LKQVESIASLPSKEELISKLMFVINAQAQRIVTVINAVPRNLAVVVKLIGEGKTDAPVDQKAEEAKPEATEQVAEPAAEASESSVTAQESESSAAPEEVTEEKSE
jgi:large subunit ribosomal protein L10